MPTRSAGPSGQLFPSHERRLSIEHTLTQDLAAARQRIETASVSPSHDIECFRRVLAAIDLERPNDLGDIARWVIEQIETGVVHMTHPSYFGLFNPAPTFPSECADRIVAAFNPQLAVWSHAPACVEIETHTLKAVASRLGLGDNAGGHFTAGGAEANFTALVCALTSADDAFTAKGARAFAGAPTFYASRESHLAWLKIAHQSGLGRESVRLVESDGLGRMDAARLKSAIDNDRNCGHVPIMVVATAGTTNAGAIDPLSACAEIARDAGLWLHVDAAWGGALIAAPRLRATLDGIELANSITLDAHKWFATTMGCGMFLVQEPSILSRAFHHGRLHAIEQGGRRSLCHIDSMVAPVSRPEIIPVASRSRLAWIRRAHRAGCQLDRTAERRTSREGMDDRQQLSSCSSLLPATRRVSAGQRHCEPRCRLRQGLDLGCSIRAPPRAQSLRHTWAINQTPHPRSCRSA